MAETETARAKCRVCASENVRGFMSPKFGYSLTCDACDFISFGYPAEQSPHDDGPCSDFDSYGNCSRCYAKFRASIGR